MLSFPPSNFQMLITLHSSGELESQEDRQAERRQHVPRRMEASEVLVVDQIIVLKERKEKQELHLWWVSDRDAGVTRGRCPILF